MYPPKPAFTGKDVADLDGKVRATTKSPINETLHDIDRITLINGPLSTGLYCHRVQHRCWQGSCSDIVLQKCKSLHRCPI